MFWILYLSFGQFTPGSRYADKSSTQRKSGWTRVIRFVKGDIPHPWIINLPADEDIYQFALLRDWLFTAILWDEDGRTLMGRLEPHPPDNDPAKARVNIRGHQDELQLLVEANPRQNHPIMQISDHGQNQSYLTVSGEGHLGVGESDPKTILTVGQHSDSDPIADAWTVYSSKRWKTNIKPIDDAMKKVQQLQGVSFDWKKSGKHDIGLVAEEVAEVIPEVVGHAPGDQAARSVDYARLVAVLIEAIKQQQEEIELLKKTVAAKD